MFKKIKEKKTTVTENIKYYNKYKANKKGLLVDTDGNNITIPEKDFDMEKVKAGKKEKRAIAIGVATAVGVGVVGGVMAVVLKNHVDSETEMKIAGSTEDEPNA